MNTNITSTTSKKTTGVVFPLLTLMLANIAIAVIYLFFTKNFNYSFKVNGEPTFALSPNLILWLTFGVIILLGMVPYFMFNLSNFKTDRPGLKLNYTLYYIHFLFFLLWAFFTFTLALPIVGIIMLGIAICIGIFTIYRFTTNTIFGGIILTLWGLWLIYLFILNLAYLLLI